MKKNKGFSLVELIIVIAIMAILAAAIAPALIRYIDKSRRADDVTAAGTIATAVQSALANEDAYDQAMSAAGTNYTAVILKAKADGTEEFQGTNVDTFRREVNSNIGGNAPKIKFQKAPAATAANCTWVVRVNSNGKPVVILRANNTDIELSPTIHDSYK